MKKIDVLIIGRSCVDYIAVVPKFPAEDTKLALQERRTEAGGQGGTAACCVSRLEGSVAYVGRLGSDAEGAFCLERLKSFGVETRHVHIVDGGVTPVAYIMVTAGTGKRTIVYEKSRLPPIQLHDIPPELLTAAEVMLLDPEVTYLAELLRKRGGRRAALVYDCERWRPGVAAMLDAADYFIPSADFLFDDPQAFAGNSFSEKLASLSKRVRGTLVITRGDRGAYFLSEGRFYRVLPPKISVRDTIGAGDNFHAAFALAASWKWPLDRCVRFASAVAALSCREYGGRLGIPRKEEALKVADELTIEPLAL